MELIFGGAWQGKHEYARAQHALTDEEIWECSAEHMPDFSRRCLSSLEQFALFCVRQGKNPTEELLPHLRPEHILLCRDISAGVVPTDAETRRWREDNGRMLSALAARADRVTRMFCGLPQVLK